jgi:hypothetical protein
MGELMKRSVLLALFLGACHAANAPSAKQPDGSWHLSCGNSLDVCVQKANDVCENRGYVVLGGMNKRQLFGAEAGVSQVEVRTAELNIACADRQGELPKVLITNTAISATPRVPEPEPAASKAPSTACTPGTTQHCVGAGACSGGQACLADGSGFAPCDCGAIKPETPPKP